MMSEQTIHKGLMIAGGLLGLGILGYLFFREKEERIEEAEFTIVEEPKLEKTEKPIIQEKIVPVVEMKPIVPVKKKEKSILVEPKAPPEPNDDFPLKLGSKGERVKQLQVYLLRNHGSQGIVNDTFDKTIEERVLKYLKVKTITAALFKKLNIAGIKNKISNDPKKKH